jgi:hypothetical protein
MDHGWRLVHQVLGTVAEFEKTTLVAKWAAARRRKRIATGEKVEGRKSHAEARPEVVKLVKALARRKPKGGKLSLRAVSATWPRAASSTSAGARSTQNLSPRC